MTISRSLSTFIAVGALATASLTNFAQAQSASASQAERVSWPSVSCTGTPGTCDKFTAQGLLFRKPGQKKIVLISHGSQGVDSRMFDYVDALQKDDTAALVIDHWTPRGIDNTHNDYAAAAIKGGSEINMVFDSLMASEWLRKDEGFEKVGSIGESQGAAAAIMLQQKWIHGLVTRNVQRAYSRGSFKVQPLDAVIALYGFCGIRVADRDAFVGTPFLFVSGAKDDETPAKLCEDFVPWMNDRGGNAKITVLPGVGHSFDAPYSMTRSSGPHYGKCNIFADGKTTKDLNSGAEVQGTDVRAALAKCSSRGYTTGNSGNRFVGVPTWTAFFQQNLN